MLLSGETDSKLLPDVLGLISFSWFSPQTASKLFRKRTDFFSVEKHRSGFKMLFTEVAL